MFLHVLSVAFLTIPILPTSTHDILHPSKVFYFDQVPSAAYAGDPDLAACKDIIYVRKDINYLDPASGPNLTCLPNGQVKLGFTNRSDLVLNELAFEQFLGHPVVIPHGYDMSACPLLANHTIFGPRQYVPAEALADLEPDDDFAVMIALSEDRVEDNMLTLSVIWVTYHELIGVVGEAPEEIFWLAKGVFPWSTSTYSSLSSPRVERRVEFGAVGKSIAKLFGNLTDEGGKEWGLERIWGKITDKVNE